MPDFKDEKIVFIGHDASLTGAPILLLNLLGLLKELGYTNLTIVLGRGGELEDQYRRLANVFVYRNIGYGTSKNFVTRALDFAKLQLQRRKFKLIVANATVVISNTIANGRLLSLIPPHIPVVTYVHELSSVIDYFNKNGDSSKSIRRSNIMACPSSAVADNLAITYSVEKSKLALLNYFFPIQPLDNSEAVKKNARERFGRQYGINSKSFWVVGMGVVSKRKGVDLFIDTCKAVTAVNSNVQFVWIGDFSGDIKRSEIEMRINSGGTSTNIHFIGKLPYDTNNLLPFDLFFMSSREDPYPLVVIEAAYHRIPTICFAGTGGIVDFVANDAGWVVPNISIKEMASKINEVQNNEHERKIFGKNAFEKAIRLHSDKSLIKTQFLGLLKAALNKS